MRPARLFTLVLRRRTATPISLCTCSHRTCRVRLESVPARPPRSNSSPRARRVCGPGTGSGNQAGNHRNDSFLFRSPPLTAPQHTRQTVCTAQACYLRRNGPLLKRITLSRSGDQTVDFLWIKSSAWRSRRESRFTVRRLGRASHKDAGPADRAR